MLEAAGQAFAHIATWQVALAIAAGTVIGVLSGALPGGTLPTLVVLLSFAYGMDPYIALALATAMIATVPTGDTLPAVLLGMPGSTSGQATILDGHPLAKQGKAGVALSAAYFASMLGGLIGAVVLFITIPVARPVVNAFGSAEFFLLGLVAIAIVGVVSSGALLRGLMVGVAGILIAMVGYDPATATERSTFGSAYLWGGIPLIPLVIGLFALPEFVDMVISDLPIAKTSGSDLMKQANTGRAQGMREVLKNWPLVLRSSGLGVFVGLLPGIGGSLAQWLAYASARQTLRGASQSFGTGDVRGVIAPESANNAVDGGQLVPTLFFGVPGSVGMAIFLGFMVIIGLQPGPDMLDKNLSMTLTIIFTLALSNVLATGLTLRYTPLLAKVAFVPPNILVPVVFAVLTLSAFQANYQIADLLVMLGFGGIGFFMKTYGWPRPPMVIAIVLAGIVEKYYSIASLTYGWGMFARGPFLAIIVVAAGVGAYTIWMQRSVERNRKRQEMEAAEDEDFGTLPRVVAAVPPPDLGPSDMGTAPATVTVKDAVRVRFALTLSGAAAILLTLFFAYFFIISQWCDAAPFCSGPDWRPTTARLPRLASGIGLVLSFLYLAHHLWKPPVGVKGRIMDIGRTQSDAPKEVVRLRTIKALATTAGLVLAVWIIGFQIAIPAYVGLYLWRFGGLRWWWSSAVALLFVALIYGFFDRLIHVIWPDPILGFILPAILTGQ